MIGDWKYAATSAIGTSHLKTEDGVCQDAHRCVITQDVGRITCVVSDGAGSATRSADASRFICDQLVMLVSRAPEDDVHTEGYARRIISELRLALEELAEAEDVPLRQFACTLLVAIVTDSVCTFWQLGDGAICFREAGQEEYRVAIWPSKGEYANTTYFLTDSNASDELEWDSVEMQIADVAVFSDGLERLALNFKTQEAHTKFFTGLFPHLYHKPAGEALDIQTQLAQFLTSDRINAKTDDDKTIILATRESL
jgi:hypothetical protein